MTINRHRIVLGGSTEDLDRDHKRIRFECAVPGCVAGLVEGVPAAAMDGLVQLLADHHGNEDEGLFEFP